MDLNNDIMFAVPHILVSGFEQRGRLFAMKVDITEFLLNINKVDVKLN